MKKQHPLINGLASLLACGTIASLLPGFAAAHDPSHQYFGLLSTGPNSLFHDPEARMAETVQRGFNCIRTECGKAITPDAACRPRGELEFHRVLPGHDHFSYELQQVRVGRVDSTPTGTWSNMRPAHGENTGTGAPWYARSPGQQTRCRTNTPSGCSERTPCS